MVVIYIFWIQGKPFYGTFEQFHQIWLHYHNCFSHLHLLLSVLIQNKPTLNQRCSALKMKFFRAKKIPADYHWFRAAFLWNSAEIFSSELLSFRENQSWAALFQNWSALKFSMFSESTLEMWDASLKTKNSYQTTFGFLFI